MVNRETNKMSCILLPNARMKCIDNLGNTMYYNVSNAGISKEAKKIKKEKIAVLMDMVKSCNDDTCEKNVELNFYGLDSCPACKSHDLVLKNVKKAFRDVNFPITVKKKNVKKKENLKNFKIVGCNGAPCVSIKVGNAKETLLYDGNKQELAVISNILGVKNPLYFETMGIKIPKRLRKK